MLFGAAVASWVKSGMSFLLGDAPLTALRQSTISEHLAGCCPLMATLVASAGPVGLAFTDHVGEGIGERREFNPEGTVGALACLLARLSPAPLSRDDSPEPDTNRQSWVWSTPTPATASKLGHTLHGHD